MVRHIQVFERFFLELGGRGNRVRSEETALTVVSIFHITPSALLKLVYLHFISDKVGPFCKDGGKGVTLYATLTHEEDIYAVT